MTAPVRDADSQSTIAAHPFSSSSSASPSSPFSSSSSSSSSSSLSSSSSMPVHASSSLKRRHAEMAAAAPSNTEEAKAEDEREEEEEEEDEEEDEVDNEFPHELALDLNSLRRSAASSEAGEDEEEEAEEQPEHVSRKFFAVAGAPDWRIAVPEDAEEYLRRVKWEARQSAHVFVAAALDAREFDALQTSGYVPLLLQMERTRAPYSQLDATWQRACHERVKALRRAHEEHVQSIEAARSAFSSSSSSSSSSGSTSSTWFATPSPSSSAAATLHSGQRDSNLTQLDAASSALLATKDGHQLPSARDFQGWLVYCLKHSRAEQDSLHLDLNQPPVKRSAFEEKEMPAVSEAKADDAPDLTANSTSSSATLSRFAPTLDVINSMDQVTTRGLLEHLIQHLENLHSRQLISSSTAASLSSSSTSSSSSSVPALNLQMSDHFCQWLFAILVHLTKPLPIDTAVHLRQLYRLCGECRAAASASDISVAAADLIARCNVLMAIIDTCFSQSVEMRSEAETVPAVQSSESSMSAIDLDDDEDATE